MKSLLIFLLFGITHKCVTSNEQTVTIMGLLDELEDNIAGNISHVERMFTAKLNQAMDRLKTEMKQNLNQQVKDALKKTHGHRAKAESIVSEMRELRQRHQKMKQELTELTKNGKPDDIKNCSGIISETQLLQNDLDVCENDSRRIMEENHQLQASLEQTTESAMTSSATSEATTSPAPSRMSPNKDRIVIAPYRSHIQHSFRQLNIRCDKIYDFQNISITRITAIVYMPHIRKMLMAVTKSRRILFSSLSAFDSKIIKRGVATHGMVVDEDTNTVFMSTQAPKRSISRMSVKGQDFTTVADLRMFNKLYSIAIDKAGKRIYTCDSTNVIVVSWNGDSVRSIAKGRFIYGLTLDGMGSLYYAAKKTLMRMSLSNHTASPVLDVGVAMNNLVHYNNLIFFSSRSWTRVNAGRIGTVDIGQNSVLRNATKVHMKFIQGIIIFKA